MKRFLCTAAIAAAIAGCSTMGNTAITQQSNFVSVKTGETNKEAIFSKFGQPHDVLNIGSKTTWRYLYVKSSPEPVMFTLGVLIWPLIFLGQTEFDITQSDFIFDDAGSLADVSSRKGEKRKSLLGVGDGFSAAHVAAGERVRQELEQCKLPFDIKAAKASLEYLSL